MCLFSGAGLSLRFLADMNYPEFREDVVSNWQPAHSLAGVAVMGTKMQRPLAFHLWLSCTCLSAWRAINGSQLVPLCYCLWHNPLFCEHIRGHSEALGPSCGNGPLFLWCSQGFPVLSVLCHISPLSVSSWHSILVFSLRTDNAACASTSSPHSLWADVSLWATSRLVVAIGIISVVNFLHKNCEFS